MIKYATDLGFRPLYPDPGSGGVVSPLVESNATLIPLNTVAIPTLVQPLADGTGSYVYWKFEVPATVGNEYSLPYGEPGHEIGSAPARFTMLFDPTLSRYALEHDGFDHAEVRVMFTETITQGATVNVFNRNYAAVDEPVEVTFYTDVHGDGGEPVTHSYSDVIIRIQCWRNTSATSPYSGRTFGANYAVLRTSRSSALTPWIQEPDVEAIVALADNGKLSAHYQGEGQTMNPASGWGYYAAPGHLGSVEYYRAYGGPHPLSAPNPDYAYETATSGMFDDGVKYWGGSLEWTGPPDDPSIAAVDSTGGWSGQDVGVSIRWAESVQLLDTLDVVVSGAGYTLPFDMVEYYWPGRRGNFSTDYSDILAQHPTQQGLHWERRNCVIKEVWVAPDHEADASRGALPTRWYYHQKPPLYGAGFGAYLTTHANGLGGTEINLHLQTGGGPQPSGVIGEDVPLTANVIASYVQNDDVDYLFQYEGGQLDWVQIPFEDAYSFMKSTTEQYNSYSGERSAKSTTPTSYFYGVPAPTVTQPNTCPVAATGANGEWVGQVNNQERLAFKFLVEPARYRLHLDPVLEPAYPLYPEQSIDINFELARRRFT